MNRRGYSEGSSVSPRRGVSSFRFRVQDTPEPCSQFPRWINVCAPEGAFHGAGSGGGRLVSPSL